MKRLKRRAVPPDGLISYKGRWKGELLLACAKCQRKLRKHEDPAGLSKLKKLLKHAQPKLFVVNIACLDVCPKGGVTVCSAAQVARGEFSILRTPEDVDRMLAAAG
jgi:hypothetical protein